MGKRSYNRMIAFRTDAEQVRRIEEIATASGLTTSIVLRQLVDSALLIGRPVIVSNYAQPPVGEHRMAVTNGG